MWTTLATLVLSTLLACEPKPSSNTPNPAHTEGLDASTTSVAATAETPNAGSSVTVPDALDAATQTTTTHPTPSSGTSTVSQESEATVELDGGVVTTSDVTTMPTLVEAGAGSDSEAGADASAESTSKQPLSGDTDAGTSASESTTVLTLGDASTATTSPSGAPDTGVASLCADGDSTLSSTPCGVNQRGKVIRTCDTGVWVDTSSCSDPDVCADATTELSTTSCGLNGRGLYNRLCVLGAWTLTADCEDLDVCVDQAVQGGTTACGLNGNGTLQQICTLGDWVDSSECLDPNVCINGSTSTGTTACGLNQRGLLTQTCTDGQWVNTATCIDPDECVDNTYDSDPGTCGLNGRGSSELSCESGEWTTTDVCTDPDECVDGAVQPGTTRCESRGALEQTCELGTWVDSATCIRPTLTQPNILLVISDDVGAEASSIYPALAGTATPVPTPTIESLAAEGITFDNAWASPMCSPTRSTVLTGKYASRTGVLTAGTLLPTEHYTLHERIGAESPEDYGLGVFGKWHLAGANGNEDQATRIQHVLDSGVETFRGFTGGVLTDFFNWEAVDQAGNLTPMQEYSTTSITNWAVEYIQQQETQNPTRPWFVYVPYNAAHDPYQAPPAHLHSLDLGGLEPSALEESVPVYQSMIQAMDTELGRLLTSVNLEETVVIYMGDNGTPGEVKDSGTNVRGSKQTVYEGGVRVPLVITGAGVTRKGEREADIVYATDLYATILSLTGLDVPQVYDSYALNPLLTNADASSGRQHAFTMLCNFTGAHYAIRNQQYKLSYEERSFQLYDLVNDPLETQNLFTNAAYASVRSELELALADIRAGSSTGCFR